MKSTGLGIQCNYRSLLAASGGYAFGTFDGEDVPVEVVDAAVAEARERLKTK